MKNDELKGKRLLILGGSLWCQSIKDFSDRSGIYLISAGLYPAGIDNIADEVYRIDTTDSDIMIPFIKEHHIDGVYMGGSEMIISAACQYINNLGLPCYCTKHQWDILQDKVNFKQLCILNGLPVVPRYEINLNDIENSIPQEAFPVITKPTDGSGSNGFSVCRNYTELKKGYELAVKKSPSGKVLVEKFVNNDSVVVFYTFSKGELYFSGLENKYPVKYQQQERYVAGLHLFESRYATDFRIRYEEKLRKMFSSLRIIEGSLWIEVFHDGDNYYFNEVGFRYSGSVSVFPVNYFYDINQIASDIYYALTGKSEIHSHPTLIPNYVPHKKYYAILNMHMLPGTISDIKGLSEIRGLNNCVYIAETKKIGDKVLASGTVAQIFAFVHFVFNSIEECKSMIDTIYNTIHVTDNQGRNMIYNMINWETRNIIM